MWTRAWFWSATLLLAVGSVYAEGDEWFPAPGVSGSLSLDYRLTVPGDQAPETEETIERVQVKAASYIWRSWLAQWTADLTLAFQQTDTGGEESTGQFLAGEGRLYAFPRSRFPAEAYFNIFDSRLDSEGVAAPGEGFRSTNLGLIQQYRPTSADSSLRAALERFSQETLTTGEENVTDQFTLQYDTHFGKQDFDFGMLLQNNRRDLDRADDTLLLVTANHLFRPDSNTSITSNVNWTLADRESSGTRSSANQFQGGSNLLWKDPRRPLRLRGNLDLEVRRDESVAGSLSESERLGVRGGVDYEFTPMLRMTADAGVTHRSGSELATFQSGSLTYTPAVLDIGGFSYHWSAAAFGGNSTGEESAWNVGASLSHGVNRVYFLSQAPVVNFTFNLAQVATNEWRSGDVHQLTLVNSGSAHLVTVREGLTANLGLTFADTAIRGDTDQRIQSANLNASLNWGLTRYSSLTGSFNSGFGRSEVQGEDSESYFSSLVFNYRNSRAFNVRNLRFESEFRADAQSYLPLGLAEKEGTLTWRNRLYHRVGLLDTKLTLNLFRREDGTNDASLIFTVRRNF